MTPNLFRRLALGLTTAAALAMIGTAPAEARRKFRIAAKPAAAVSRPIVAFSTDYAAGSIIVVNSQRRLYYVHEKGKAMVYPVAIGKPGDQWTGQLFVQSRAVNPAWIQPETGRRVPGGPGNPLGVRALYLGWTHYRIHGTNAPGSIGSAASHGCFRMFNEHVKDLYARVHIGAPVFVINTLAAPVTAAAAVTQAPG